MRGCVGSLATCCGVRGAASQKPQARRHANCMRAAAAHQHAGSQRQRRLGQAAAVHQRDRRRPVAMAVKQRADDAAVEDACARRRARRRGTAVPASADRLLAPLLRPAVCAARRRVANATATRARVRTRECAVLCWYGHARLEAVLYALALQVQPLRVRRPCKGSSMRRRAAGRAGERGARQPRRRQQAACGEGSGTWRRQGAHAHARRLLACVRPGARPHAPQPKQCDFGVYATCTATSCSPSGMMPASLTAGCSMLLQGLTAWPCACRKCQRSPSALSP